MINEQIWKEVAEIEKERRNLVKVLDEYRVPLLRDTSLIGEIYAKAQHLGIHRRAFLFVVYYLYCPQKILFDINVNRGFTLQINKATGIPQTLLSHNSRHLAFSYFHDATFHDEADELFAEVVEGILNDQNISINVIEDYMNKYEKKENE